ncbi:MAG: hypothetical protein AAF348_18725 [Bacteroidota bacterium]
MRVFENNQNVHMMIWETNPRKRNVNNVVKFVSDNDHQVGDKILGQLTGDISFSTYEITEIINERPSSSKGKKYYEVVTKWYMQNAVDLKDQLSTVTQNRIDRMVDALEKEKEKQPKVYHKKQ